MNKNYSGKITIKYSWKMRLQQLWYQLTTSREEKRFNQSMMEAMSKQLTADLLGKTNE